VVHAGVPPHEAAVLWTQVGVLLGLAWALGALARRLGQPPIAGSLVAGLIAGPSVFGQVWPAGWAWFRPDSTLSAGLLGALAQFCLLILLIALGAETDLALIRRHGRPAAAAVAGSLLVPLAAGAATAAVLPSEFLADEPHRVSFVILVAAAMSVSSLPVIARIATEMRVTRRTVGQLAVAAATVNDGVGFALLALAVALSGGGSRSLVTALVGLPLLVLVLATAGRQGADRALRASRRFGPDVGSGVAVSAVLTFASAAAAQAAGIDAALGAFLAGVVLGRSPFLARRVMETIRWFSDALFAPLYFATAGLAVDVSVLADSTTATWFVAVVLVAVIAKFASVYAAARLTGSGGHEASALGVILNGRGALQVIIGSAGMAAGVISTTMFTVIVLLSIISSVSVPPLLRLSLRGWGGTEEERERLAYEEEMRTNVVVRGQRLLLPSRADANSAAAARVLDLAWPVHSEVTILRMTGDDDDAFMATLRATFADRRIVEEAAQADGVVDSILRHANLGYGAIGVGAADHPTADNLLPPYIEELLNRSPIPLVIVRHGDDRVHDGRPLVRPRRILVPVTGNAASRAGQEVAQLISRNTGADLTVMHVLTRPTGDDVAGHPEPPRLRASATAVLEEARRRADQKQLDADLVLRDGAFSGAEIEAEARRIDADLVVVATTVHRMDGRPVLGHTVEHLLEHVSGPMVVAIVLPDAQQAAADEHIDRESG
jgi:Kef-type K+ transport system membrane component KefB/nucleotide-binding universal stress UspA family protein